MTHWQECPTCAQDFDVDRWGWNDETAEAWRLAKAAPDLLAALERLVADVDAEEYINQTAHSTDDYDMAFTAIEKATQS